MARLKYWVWLSCVSGVRPLSKYRLAQAMGGPENLFFARRDELTAHGATESEARRLEDKSMLAAGRAVSACEERGIDIVTLQDACYPERLRNIPDPPVVLYIWGGLPPVDESVVVGVIGTRRATAYGVRAASALGRDIARGGGIVVSGIAEGCDGAAMEAALRAGGTVIGVLGTAIDSVYPKKNKWLFEETRHRGALVSEYAPGARTYASDFVARNRIIAGLSLGVAVAEAPLRSGTQTTVRFALEQGRDVFAVPGNVDAAAAEGCNALIAHGAIPVSDGAEVMAEYAARTDLVRRDISVSDTTPIKKEIDKKKDIVYIDLTEEPNGLDEDQRRILSAMTGKSMHADDIIAAAGLPAPRALAALTFLQMAGHITQDAGRRYTRKL